MEKNDPYLNDHQFQNPADRDKVLASNIEHPNTNRSRDLPPEGDYIEISDLGCHRKSINFHQIRMIKKGKFCDCFLSTFNNKLEICI